MWFGGLLCSVQNGMESNPRGIANRQMKSKFCLHSTETFCTSLLFPFVAAQGGDSIQVPSVEAFNGDRFRKVENALVIFATYSLDEIIISMY